MATDEGVRDGLKAGDADQHGGPTLLLRAIEAISRSLTTSLDLDDVLDTIAGRAMEVMGAEAARIIAWDGRSPTYRVMRAVGRFSRRYAAAGAVPASAGPISRAVLESRSVTTSNVLADPSVWLPAERRAEIEREGYKAVATAPLASKGRIHGALVVHYWNERTFTTAEENALVLLAEHAALAMDGAQLFGEATRHAQRLRELAEVQRLVSSTLELSDVLTRIAQCTARLVDVPIALVWTVEPGGRAIRRRAISLEPGLPERPAIPDVLAFGEGIGGRVAESRHRLFVTDVARESRMVAPEWASRMGLTTLLSVPIEAGDDVLGVLTVAGRPGALASPEDHDLVASMAAQAGVAVRNAALYQAERELTERARTLATINRRISAALDLDELLRMIAESAAQLTGARFVTFWLADDATRTLSFRGGSDPEIAKDFPEASRSYDVGAAGWVARHRAPLHIADVFADERVVPIAWWRRWGLRSFSALPVVAGDELLAVVSLSHVAPVELSPQTREVLDLFIGQAAVAIQNARLYRAAQRRRDVAEALARLGRELTRSLDHQHIARLVAQGLVELLGSRNSTVYSRAADGSLRALASSGPDSERLEGVVLAPGEGVAGQAAAERRPVRSADVLRDPSVRLSAELRTRLADDRHRALVSVPLIARDQVIGALILADDVDAAPDYGPEELQVLQTFADQAAIALDNARLYAAARESLARLRETQAQLVQAGKLSAVGQLVSGVAHELNNPLSVIIGYGQLLSGRQLPEAMRRPLEMIVQQGDRMAKIVQNLLYFSRQRPAERARLDLHDIIEQTLTLRLNQLKFSGIAVEREFAPDLPMITGDRYQLQQVFLNLLLNAEQAITGAGREAGRIAFRTAVVDGGRRVRASVIDDGPGIAADVLPRVFEPFFTTKDVGAGTGLGLSVSYGIVQQHHGQLSVDSRPGETAFILELPIGAVSAAEGAAAAIDEPPLDGAGRRVLVVDDESSVRDFVVALLEETGWRVDVAAGGRAALAMVRAHPYALVVSDMRMPEGSGEELYRGAVALDGALAERFVFITGDTANPAAWTFFQRTSAAVLEKPFATAALLDAVRRIGSRVAQQAH